MGQTVPEVNHFRALPSPDCAIWPQFLLDVSYRGVAPRRPGTGAVQGIRDLRPSLLMLTSWGASTRHTRAWFRLVWKGPGAAAATYVFKILKSQAGFS